MKGLKQDKRGATNSLVFTNADNSVGELAFDGSKFTFSDPVTFGTGLQQLLPAGTVDAPSLSISSPIQVTSDVDRSVLAVWTLAYPFLEAIRPDLSITQLIAVNAKLGDRSTEES
jgi:hypothetical protein